MEADTINEGLCSRTFSIIIDDEIMEEEEETTETRTRRTTTTIESLERDVEVRQRNFPSLFRIGKRFLFLSLALSSER